MDIQPGTVIDRYRLDVQLGAGAFGSVWRATHTVLHAQHAVKVLSPELAARPAITERFLQEGRIQAQLQHPHIVRVTDVVHAGGWAALVMDYIDGVSLADAIDARKTPLTLAEVQAVVLPLLDALAHAHARNVVHRDIKPANILLRGGALDDPIIVDFGIAKVAADALAGQQHQATRTGMQMGTPEYMSPEQIRGAGHVDQRTDVFAMGAVLYELMTLSRAFDGGSQFDTWERIVRGPRPTLSGDRPADRPISTIIAKATAVEPDERYANCTVFREAVATLGTAPVGAPAPAPPAPPAAARSAPDAPGVTAAVPAGHAPPSPGTLRPRPGTGPGATAPKGPTVSPSTLRPGPAAGQTGSDDVWPPPRRGAPLWLAGLGLLLAGGAVAAIGWTAGQGEPSAPPADTVRASTGTEAPSTPSAATTTPDDTPTPSTSAASTPKATKASPVSSTGSAAATPSAGSGKTPAASGSTVDAPDPDPEAPRPVEPTQAAEDDDPTPVRLPGIAARPSQTLDRIAGMAGLPDLGDLRLPDIPAEPDARPARPQPVATRPAVERQPVRTPTASGADAASQAIRRIIDTDNSARTCLRDALTRGEIGRDSQLDAAIRIDGGRATQVTLRDAALERGRLGACLEDALTAKVYPPLSDARVFRHTFQVK